MLHGFLMALADSVPGVSGGTIAFIMGFYERFLGAVSSFFGKDGGKRKDAFRYLVKFALGWGLGMGSSVLILALVVILTAFRANISGTGGLNFQALSVLQYVYLLVAGALAISAMLLPGISGSTLLLIFGVYVPLIGAVKEVMHFHLQYLPGVAAAAVGVLLGVIFASRLIRKALSQYRCQTVYLILGLMVGSLYAITMAPPPWTCQSPRWPSPPSSCLPSCWASPFSAAWNGLSMYPKTAPQK